MLKHRIITAQLGGESVLSQLSNHGFDIQGYADDLTIIIRGKFDRINSELMQEAVRPIWQWCSQEGLSVNPNKTVIVPFTRRANLLLTPISLNGTLINLSQEIKYLGVVLDYKVNWKQHVLKVQKRAAKAFWAYQRLYCRTWGLQPNMIYRSFLTIIRPMITCFGSMVA